MGGRYGPMIAIREALKRFDPKKDDRKMYFGGIRQFRASDIKIISSMPGGSFGLVRLITTENESNALFIQCLCLRHYPTTGRACRAPRRRQRQKSCAQNPKKCH